MVKSRGSVEDRYILDRRGGRKMTVIGQQRASLRWVNYDSCVSYSKANLNPRYASPSTIQDCDEVNDRVSWI